MSPIATLESPDNRTIVRSLNDASRELSRPLVLADRTRVWMRPIRPDDDRGLEALFRRLGPRTVYERFFTLTPRLTPETYRHLARVDGRTRLALVAEDDATPGRPLRAVARYEPGTVPDAVDAAIVVEDGWQGRGLGRQLFEALLEAGEARGHPRFTADILAENRRMFALLLRVADIRHRELAHGVVTVEFERRRTPDLPVRGEAQP